MLAELLSLKFILLYVLVGSALYVHFRGRVRHKFARQLTDHSTFAAPYNTFVYLFSKVPNKPILDRKDFPQLDTLQDNWEIIRDEAKALMDAGHLTAADSYNDLAFNSFFRRGWKRFYFKWYGDYLPSAKQLAPKTIELIEQVPSVHAAMLTVLPAGSRLGKHRDPFAGSVRYHLGLVTPNSDACRINVDDQVYSWRDGEDVLFDETYIHRAHNETDEPRLIFFADVERPLNNRVATAINRFVIRHLVKLTQARNDDSEKVGFFNKAFNVVYRVRLPLKRLKKKSVTTYYALKYAAMALAVTALIVWM